MLLYFVGPKPFVRPGAVRTNVTILLWGPTPLGPGGVLVRRERSVTYDEAHTVYIYCIIWLYTTTIPYAACSVRDSAL